MKSLYLLLILAISLFACNSNKQEQSNSNEKEQSQNNIQEVIDSIRVEDTINSEEFLENIDTIPVDEYYTDPLVVSYTKLSDTMLINEDCVIFLWPDSLEIIEMQNKYPEGYIEILDDMIYYASDAAIALDNEGIRNFFCDKSIVQFVTKPKDVFIDRKKTNGNMIFFKYGKTPYISYAIEFNLDTCRTYFAETIIDTISIE